MVGFFLSFFFLEKFGEETGLHFSNEWCQDENVE